VDRGGGPYTGLEVKDIAHHSDGSGSGRRTICDRDRPPGFLLRVGGCLSPVDPLQLRLDLAVRALTR
jgi:hypothetical protein